MGTKSKTKAPEITHREAEYLKQLIGKKSTIEVTLSDGTTAKGLFASFDQYALEVLLPGETEPRLIMKDEIRTLRDAS